MNKFENQAPHCSGYTGDYFFKHTETYQNPSKFYILK